MLFLFQRLSFPLSIALLCGSEKLSFGRKISIFRFNQKTQDEFIMKQQILFAILILMLLGCGSRKKTVSKKNDRIPKKEVAKKEPRKEPSVVFTPPIEMSYQERVDWYISTYGDTAMEEMRRHGVPASITLAQGILESGAGASELTLKSNNHFGIKCHKEWNGKGVYHDDDRRGECFRKYGDPRASYRDHSLFLAERRRYGTLFELEKDDYKAWAKGLKKAGYATDPRYANKLIDLIERYDLHRFDEEVVGKKSKKKRKKKEEPIYHTVVKGDTLYSLARRYNLSVDDIKFRNRLENNTIQVGQMLIIEVSTKQYEIPEK